MEGAFRRNILDSRIVPEQVVSRDPLNLGVVEDTLECRPEAGDVLGLGADEEVQVLRSPRQPVQIQGNAPEIAYSTPSRWSAAKTSQVRSKSMSPILPAAQGYPHGRERGEGSRSRVAPGQQALPLMPDSP